MSQTSEEQIKDTHFSLRVGVATVDLCTNPDAAGPATANPATWPASTMHKEPRFGFPHSQRNPLTFLMEFARFVCSNFPFIPVRVIHSFQRAVKSVAIVIHDSRPIFLGGFWMIGPLSLSGIGWTHCDMR
jgi:hypothetical protein